jgi:cytoskeletal protein RodZ
VRRGPPAGAPLRETEPQPRREPASPGEILRAARLRRRISLAEAEQATRIRQRYLQALEDDDLSALPAGAYVRGFLRNYAIFLGVPPDQVLQGVRERRPRDRRATLRAPSRPVRLGVPRAMWGLAAVASVGGLVVLILLWLGVTAPEESARTAGSAPAATATPLVQLPPLAPPATPTVLPTTVPGPSATPTAGGRQVEVELRTLDRAWVRATVDGRVVFEETLPPGQVQRWTGQQSVALRVGNAGGVELTVNGQRVGPLGPPGQPVDREFTR